MHLKDKVAIVTGSTRGIGKAIAEELVAHGAQVVISGRNVNTVAAVVETINNNGGTAFGIPADVRDSEDAKKLITKTVEQFGRIDVLVNNAGITRDNLIMRMSEEEWDEVIQTNLKGVYNCVRAAAKTFMKQRQGRIINITSVVGIMGNAGQVNYAASKAGIIGLTKSLARELSARNILVNAVAPGFIDTDMTAELSESARAGLLNSIPLKRLGTGKDVAGLVSFLASDEASYITGQVFNVDGGMVM